MTLEIGRYCAYRPGGTRPQDRIYEAIEQRWGSQLEKLPRLDKLEVLSVIAYTMAFSEKFPNFGYDINCTLDNIQSLTNVSPETMDFLQLAAGLPQVEYLNLCESLINQLKYQRGGSNA